jgi:hypothetical protein
MDMDSHEIFFIVIIQIQEIQALPVFQRAKHIFLGMVELVRDIGHTGSLSGAHHAEQVKIDLQLCIIGVSHIFVDKKVGYNGGIRSCFSVNCQMRHFDTPLSILFEWLGSDLPSLPGYGPEAETLRE